MVKVRRDLRRCGVKVGEGDVRMGGCDVRVGVRGGCEETEEV